MSSRQFLTDAATRHQIFLQRYGAGQGKEARTVLNRLRRNINARLAQEPTVFQRQRLVAVLDDVNGLAAEAFSTIKRKSIFGATELAQSEARFSVKLFNKSTNVAAGWTLPSDAQLIAGVMGSSMGVNVNSAISIENALDQFTKVKTKGILDTISDGVTLGDPTHKISKDVGNLVAGLQSKQATALASTITNHTSSVTRGIVYDENADLLEGYQWIATLDGNTTIICGDRDLRVYKDMRSDPKPPAHWNCRSTTIPVVKKEFDLGAGGKTTRPSVGTKGAKQISGKTGYPGWLKRQPVAFIDEALGVERSRLFRSGKLTLDKFVDPTGRVYTLKQLEDMNPFAFIDDTGGVKDVVPTPPVIPKPKKEVITAPNKARKKSVVKKELDEMLALGADDSRYLRDADGVPITRFRANRGKRGLSSNEIRLEKIGKANITTITDEAATMLVATVREANLVLDKYNIQPLRAVSTGAGRGAVASMGDGMLAINKKWFNKMGADLNPKKVTKLEKKLLGLDKELELIRDELNTISATFGNRSVEYRIAGEKYNKKIRAYNKTRKDILEATPDKMIKSKWQVGDDLRNRPYTAESYFDTGFENMRSTVLHESGHQIHQQYLVDSLNALKAPVLESKLEIMFARHRTITPTKYAGKNSKEWFAESFALHEMGRLDLVDPIITGLLNAIKHGEFDEYVKGFI